MWPIVDRRRTTLLEDHSGRVAAVTGAAQGIGQATSASLLGCGFRVAMADIQYDHARDAAGALGPKSRIQAFAVDVRSRDSIALMVREVRESFGEIDVLINNAGITIRSDYWHIGDEEWDRVLETNLRSVFVTCQLVAPGMRQRRWGRIVNMGSLAGQQGGLVAGAHYAASKAGVIVLTKVLARELAGSGVTVNAVAPAAIDTPVIAGDSEAERASLVGAVPVGRLGTPEEVAALVAYLCSPQASFITGATFDINGGIAMR